MRKGFVHLIPILAAAVIVLIGVFAHINNKKIADVNKVLSSSDEDSSHGGSSSSGSSGSGSSGSGESSESKSGDENKSSSQTSPGSTSTSNTNSGSRSSNTTKVESRTGQGTTKIETENDKTEIEVRNDQGRFKTKIEDGKEETKIRTGNLRIEIRQEGNKLVTKIKNENDEEIELEDKQENELLDEAENELENDGVKIATDSGHLDIIQNGRRARTNFPLSVNPATGELFVTTPAGEKVVAVLPDQAIQNMLKAGILTRVEPQPEPSPSPSPGATESATIAETGIELAQVNNNPVYIISGVKNKNFLGIVPVDLKLKVVVSAQNGQVVETRQGLLTRLLDFFSI